MPARRFSHAGGPGVDTPGVDTPGVSTPVTNGAIFHAGDGHAVLLLHGLSSSPVEMRFLARTLHREGMSVSAPMLDGYSLDQDAPRMERWIDAAVAAFDDLARRYPRVSVCGLSMGATLALAVVQRRPAAQALALLSTTLDYDGWAIPWYRFLLGWLYYSPWRHRWRYRETEPFGLKNAALRAKVARSMESTDFSEIGPATLSLPAIHEASRLAAHVSKRLPEIRSDCLLIHAIDDETASAKNARLVLARIGSVFRRAIFLDDSYHMITVDNERELVARETVVFLRESEAAASGAAHATPVVSRALARRLRQIAAVAK